MTKLRKKVFQILLYAGATFYLIGAVAHYFGLSLFPWYDAALYSPYHDTLISCFALFLSVLLIAIANRPLKNLELVHVVICGIIFISIVSILMPFKIDFAALGAPLKKTETIIEGVAGLLYAAALWWVTKNQF